MSNGFRFVFDLLDYSEYLDLNKFQFFHVAICGFILAIATDKHLILSDAVSDGSSQQEATVRVVLEFNEESIRATTLTWLSDDIICVGFESGYVVCFNCQGEEVFECKGNNSAVQSVRVCNTDANGKGTGLWILYEHGRFITIPLAQVLKGRADSLIAFRLADRTSASDFVFCPTVYSASVFDLDEAGSGSSVPSHSVLVAGMNSALSVYNLGGKAHFSPSSGAQESDRQQSGQGRDRVSSMISKSFMSLFSSVSAAISSAPQSGADQHQAWMTADCCDRVEERCVTIGSVVDPLLDAKRRVMRLSMEPYGSLVAAADSLGRVTLYDTASHCVVRVWKGLRDARLAWTHTQQLVDAATADIPTDSGLERRESITTTDSAAAVLESSTSCVLHLVVYAPQLGLVSVYSVTLPGAPCLRIIPVGLHAQLLTVMDETATGTRVAKCFLLRGADSGGGEEEDSAGCAVEMVEIDPVQTADSDIDVHSAALLSREGLGGGQGDSAGTDDDASAWELADDNDDSGAQTAHASHGITGGRMRALSKKATELRALQRVERVLRHLAEMHGSFFGRGGGDKAGLSLCSSRDLEASARVVDGDLVASAEQQILETLGECGKCFTVGADGLARVLRAVHSLELTGCYDSGAGPPTTVTAARAASPLQRMTSSTSLAAQQHPICFSAQFHRKLTSQLDAALLTEGSTRADAAWMGSEVRLRNKLLSAYEVLRGMHAAESADMHPRYSGSGSNSQQRNSRGDSNDRSVSVVSSPAAGVSGLSTVVAGGQSSSPLQQPMSTSPLPGGEEAAAICRGNSTRAEALCWSLRAISRSEKKAARSRMRRLKEERSRAGAAAGVHSPKIFRAMNAGHSANQSSVATSELNSRRSPMKSALNHHTTMRVLQTGNGDLPAVDPAHNGNTGRTVSVSSGGRSSEGEATSAVVVLRPVVGDSLAWSKGSAERATLSFDHRIVSFALFRAFHEHWYAADADMCSPVRLRSNDLLQFVDAADRYFSACRVTADGQDMLSGTPSSLPSPMRKTAALHSVLAQSGNSSGAVSGSPSLAALRSRKQLSRVNDVTTAAVDSGREMGSSVVTPRAKFVLRVENAWGGGAEVSTHQLLQEWTPRPADMRLSYSLLSFLVAPLQGDIFNMNSFGAALRQMGAAGPEGIRRLSSLFLSFLAHQPVSTLVASVLTRKLSSSPFQRWLRDSLLTLQDTVTAVGEEVLLELFAAGEGCNSGKVNRDRKGDPGPSDRTARQGNNLLADLAGESLATAEEEQEQHHANGEETEPQLSERGSSQVAGGMGGSSRTSSFSEDSEYQQLSVVAKEVIIARSASLAPSEATDNHDDGPVQITYDEYVKHLLRPAWQAARTCPNLEAVMAFAAVVLETLAAVHEQVERRTYGAFGLSQSMVVWENLVRQTRVAILLASRASSDASPGQPAFTVERLGSGAVSLHRLLAADTLCFAVRADQAVEHEERCQEVFNRRNAAVSGPELSDASAKSDVLLAWGKVADRRWRDLIAVAVAEDAVLDSEEAMPEAAAEPTEAGDDAAAAAAQRRRPPMRRRRPLLLYFPRHSQTRFLGAYRGILLADRWIVNAHRVEGLVAVSEHLFGLPHNWRGAVAAHIYENHVLPLVRLFLSMEEDVQQSLAGGLQQQGRSQTQTAATGNSGSPEGVQLVRSQQLLLIMSDVALLKTFVRATTELLKFAEVSIAQHQQQQQQQQQQEFPPAALSPTALPLKNSATDPYNQDTVSMESGAWPSVTDSWLTAQYEKFYGGLIHSAGRNSIAVGSDLCSVASVQAHVSLLWVLQLRFQCGLRGIKPSRVLGRATLEIVERCHSSASGEPVSVDCRDLRMEFLDQCLRRLISVEPPVLVYRLAELWGINTDSVRLLHLTALLERDGSLDDEADLLVPQIADSGAVVDTVTAALRARLGGVLMRIDRLSTFGPLLAAMDAEAVTWARRAFPADAAIDLATLEEVSKGRVRAVNVNLASTRHLVISMQGILLAVPVTERYTNTSSGEGSSWLERKGKCDALLSLCNSFSHLVSTYPTAAGKSK